MTDRHRLTIRGFGGNAAAASAETIRLRVARVRGLAATMVGVQLAGRQGSTARSPLCDRFGHPGAPPEAEAGTG